MMETSREKPPLFDEIVAVFWGAAGPGVIFCWGNTMHVPRPVLAAVPPELVAHETVHCLRQGNDPEGWWRRYLVDEKFRLDEEFPAHCAEFRALCTMHRHKWVSARSMHRVFARRIAEKLASPLYGDMISIADAKALILESANVPSDRWGEFLMSGTADSHHAAMSKRRQAFLEGQ